MRALKFFIALALASGAFAAVDPAPTPVPASIGPWFPQADDDLTPTAMAMVHEAQAEVLRLHFSKAKQICAQAEAMDPEHPLPLVMDVGVRLYEIQESIEGGLKDEKIYGEFYAKVDTVIKLALEREQQYPKSPYPKMHLGAAYGCRGLVKLYQSNYLTSYRDGKRGVEYLQKAVDLDPARYDSYMGLGQFEYYCARLNGLLQYILALQGDEKKGIEMLKLCESKGTYSAWACRVFLVKVLVYDQRNWADVEPYLDKVYKSFPENYHHVGMAVTYAVGNGMDKAKSREFMELVCGRWDQGWRPPAYVTENSVEPARLELAQYYLKVGKDTEARRHLQALSHSTNDGLAKLALGLLSKMK